MSYGDLTHSEGQPDGRALAWATWSRLRAFASHRGDFLGRTSENGVWRARRLVMVLFAMTGLPAGAHVSLTHIGIQYVPPVLSDELERSGREAAAQAETTLNRRIADSSVKFEWRRLPGVIEDVITLHARCPDLTVVSHANSNESAQRRLVALTVNVAPSTCQPVLAAPYVGLPQTPGNFAPTAWNAGRNATRSIGDITPVLERLALKPNENRDERGVLPCPDVVRHAARRDVGAEAAKTKGNGIDVSDILLSQVAYTESGLLAMGAYGHTHLQEN